MIQASKLACDISIVIKSIPSDWSIENPRWRPSRTRATKGSDDTSMRLPAPTASNRKTSPSDRHRNSADTTCTTYRRAVGGNIVPFRAVTDDDRLVSMFTTSLWWRSKGDWMLGSFHFHRGPSMYGINYQSTLHASSVKMFKNRIDKYLVKAG